MAHDDQNAPGKLIDEVPGPDGNVRTYLVLADDREVHRKVPLPYHFRKEELALPGNLQMHEDGKIIALYDESTRTGALFDGVATTPHWRLIQPITRDMFFNQEAPNYVRALRLCGHLPFTFGK